MIRTFVLAAVVTAALVSSASADFVFTNIGTAPVPSTANGDFSASSGFDISSGGGSGHPQHYEGMKFTAGTNYAATSYEVAFINTGTYTGGTVQLQLTADAGGASGPDFGTVLDTKTVIATAATESIGTAAASAGVSLVSGTSYWLVATMLSPNSAIVWATGAKPLTSPANGVFQGTTPPTGTISTQNQAGFRIQGTPTAAGIPEPSSFVLAAISASFGLGTWGWRRRRAQQPAATV